MPIEFRYFRAPESETGFLPGLRTCSLCGQPGRCFPLDQADFSEVEEGQRRGKTGCYECLRRNRYGFAHTTDVGYITENSLETFGEFDETPQRVFVVDAAGAAAAEDIPLHHPPKPQVSEQAVTELRRTPTFATWQELVWPVHCNDFMAYRGIEDNSVIFECLHCDAREEIDDPD